MEISCGLFGAVLSSQAKGKSHSSTAAKCMLGSIAIEIDSFMLYVRDINSDMCYFCFNAYFDQIKRERTVLNSQDCFVLLKH